MLWFTNWPNFHITISGSVVAAYAAVLSTITGAAQLWNYNRDRARIEVSLRKNMQIYGDPKYEGKTLCIIQVSNLGRRPVTITSVGGHRAYPALSFVIQDCQPSLPHELTEGKRLVAIMEMSVMDVSEVLWWTASDAVGHNYDSTEASWLARRRFKKSWTKSTTEKKRVK